MLAHDSHRIGAVSRRKQTEYFTSTFVSLSSPLFLNRNRVTGGKKGEGK